MQKFQICGIIAIVLGAKVIGSLNNLNVQPQATVHSLAVALIIFGFVIFVVSAVGSYSVIKDSERGLIIFGVALGALIILKIIVAIIVLSFMNDAIAVSRKEITKTFNEGVTAKDDIDNIQRAVSKTTFF